jgi:hypothetical protein
LGARADRGLIQGGHDNYKVINQGEMLDPAGKRDEATHHVVKKLGDK